MQNEWVDTNRKFADITRTFIRIEDLIQFLFVRVSRRFYYFTVLESELDIIEDSSLIKRGSIVSNRPVN